MKRICFLFVLCILICVNSMECLACTSFAVYSDRVIYGMNFDFHDTEISVRIDDIDEYNRVFYMFFEAFNVTGKNALLNDKGLFTAVQNQYPEEPFAFSPSEEYEVLSGFAMWTPYIFDNVGQIKEMMYDRPMQHVYGSFHNLFADTGGDAMVLELDNNELIQTNINEDFIVMTNFANARLEETSYKDIVEIGADRYAAAYEMIQENFKDFDVEQAFEVLEGACQIIGGFPTQYSIVHDPVNQLSYLSVKGDFDRIWKITLEDKKLETYKGFREPMVYEIGGEGVPLSQLIAYEKNDAMLKPSGAINVSAAAGIIIAFAAFIVIIVVMLRKRSKRVG